MILTDEQVAAMRVKITEHIGDTDNAYDPHSWRCMNPDRFPGYCTCVNDLLTDLVDAVHMTPGTSWGQIPALVSPTTGRYIVPAVGSQTEEP